MNDNEALIDLGDATVETREPPEADLRDSALQRSYEDGIL